MPEEVVSDNGVKRRRVSVACSSCRLRKSRCNGGRPKCTTCMSSGCECRYEQPTGPVLGVRKEPNNSGSFLEARVADLEKLLQSNNSRETASERISSLPSASDSQCFSTIESLSDYSGEAQAENVDALASITLSESDDYQCQIPYFGGSSNISLIQQITSQLLFNEDSHVFSTITAASDGQLTARTFSDTGQASIHVSGPSSKLDADPYAFPPVTETNHLIHVYFSTVHLFLPCLDERSFIRKYKACQTGKPKSIASVSGAWLGSFYIVLSLACQCLEATSPESSRATESEVYYRKALNAGMKHAIYGMGFEVVQFLVLLTAYLQSTYRSTESWTFHSLAVKSAFQIALYSKVPFARLSALEKEVRQKCWLCLVYNDRVMSIAFGRPGLIQRSYSNCDFPSDSLDELPPVSVTKKVALLSNLHFRELITLSKIAADIAEILYSNTHWNAEKLTVSTTVSRTVEALGKLSQWRSNLPKPLQILDLKELPEPKISANLDLYSTRFRVFLSLRYLSSRILAYRAVLDLYLKETETNENPSDYPESLEDVSLALLGDCAICCRLVIDIAKSVVRVSEEGININGAWWLSTHFAFNASLVLLGVNLAIRRTNSRSSQSRLADSLDENRRAMDDAATVMHRLDRGNVVIAGCRNALIRFTRMYDALGASELGQFSMRSHAPELSSSSQTYHSNSSLRDDGLAAGNLTEMSPIFDDFAAYSNFNFFSDTLPSQ